MPENPYQWSNAALVQRFMDACRRAGLSGSGVVLDPFASHDHREAHYLKWVVLARLEGAIPPFAPGDMVKPISRLRVRPHYMSKGPTLSEEDLFTVTQVIYQGEGQWQLSLQQQSGQIRSVEMEYARYDANQFIRADPEPALAG